MRQRASFFSITILVVCFALKDNGCKEKDYIVWEKPKQLKWEYFQSTRIPEDDTGATSSVQILFEYEVKDQLKWVSAKCIFLKKESFAGPTRTEYVLNHEQGHFDIGEIYVRILRKEILKISKRISRDNYLQMDSLLNKLKVALLQEQRLYDTETYGSQKRIEQKVWDDKIKNRLDSMSAFSKHKYWF